ncbi:MAG: hypothetical protein KI790_03340 [Cyclobacteriaceae bacterium]|nr:hypothetical protein [Cyclobacteriaceae bacterium HetDA_MAG_MS6]
MGKKILLTLLIHGWVFTGFGQKSENPWKVFGQVTYDKSSDEYGEIYVPNFNQNIRALEGHEISLTGYIIPFEGMFEPRHVIISSLPIASCFFCGSGGPETVAEAYLQEEIRYTAKSVTVTGKLELNNEDDNQLMFILREATVKVN